MRTQDPVHRSTLDHNGEDDDEGLDVEPPIELDPVEPKLLVLDGVLLKLLVLL